MITILIGDDEFSIQNQISNCKGQLGDETTAAINIKEIDGRNASITELQNEIFAVPFLAAQRVVVLLEPYLLPKNEEEIKTLLIMFDQCPDSTHIIIIIYDERKYNPKTRTYEWQTYNNKTWLKKWVNSSHKTQVYLQEFAMPKGRDLALRLRKEADNKISLAALEKLLYLIGEDAKNIQQEIQKLLTYVNDGREVNEQDVELLVSRTREESIFEFVDALGNRNAAKAAKTLDILLDQQEGFQILAMIIRQFRLLIQTKDLYENGKSLEEIAAKVSDFQHRTFMVKKIIPQLSHFSHESLNAIYHALLDMDEKLKTGQISIDTALFTFVAAVTSL